MIPVPLPSHPGIGERHIGHRGGLAALPLGPGYGTPARFRFAFTAEKRHSPHMTWPQGVRQALVGGQKQIGQLYSSKNSWSGCLGGEGGKVTGSADAEEVNFEGFPESPKNGARSPGKA